MIATLIGLKAESEAMNKICNISRWVERQIELDADSFSWDDLTLIDRVHYPQVFSLIRDGACPVKKVPITDTKIRSQLWKYAKMYTISDEHGNLLYTYLVGYKRNPDIELSDDVKKAIGLHVGDLSGPVLSRNFLYRSLGVLLYDITHQCSRLNFGKIPEIVRLRMFNDSRNLINRCGDTYELYNFKGRPIMYVTPRKKLFSRTDTAKIKYPYGGVKIFDKLDDLERCVILAKLRGRYNHNR